MMKKLKEKGVERKESEKERKKKSVVHLDREEANRQDLVEELESFLVTWYRYQRLLLICK